MRKKSLGRRKWSPDLVLTAAISLILLIPGCVFFVDQKRSDAKWIVWQRNTFNKGTADDRTTISLLFRNCSRRPTSVVDVYVREGENILGGPGYKNRIELPFQIESRGIKHLEFRIDKDDERRMTNILIRDIKNNQFVIERATGRNWIKGKPEVRWVSLPAMKQPNITGLPTEEALIAP